MNGDRWDAQPSYLRVTLDHVRGPKLKLLKQSSIRVRDISNT